MLSKNVLNCTTRLGKLILLGSKQQQVRYASAFKFVPETAPAELGETTKMNLCQSVTNALDITLSSDKSSGGRFFILPGFLN